MEDLNTYQDKFSENPSSGQHGFEKERQKNLGM
jgi:hypothetical protein